MRDTRFLNERTAAAMIEIARSGWPKTIREDLHPRICSSPSYAFGFTGWKLAASTAQIAGQFLVALAPAEFPGWGAFMQARADGYREHGRFDLTPTYYGVTTIYADWALTKPELIRPVRFLRGDVFDISQAPLAHEIEELNAAEMVSYFREHLDALRDFIHANEKAPE